ERDVSDRSGYTTVQKVYAYEPVPEELNGEEARYILGAQGNVWTEYILTEDHVEYMAVPRMLALSEVLWSPAALRNETDFLHRLKAEFPKLERLNVNAAQSMFDPVLHLAQGTNTGEVMAAMECPCEGQPFALECAQLGRSALHRSRSLSERQPHHPRLVQGHP
ncbi:MAG: family 20 glycosylhydrolase, partial [Flavobacteriales bacterium]|nr:family 20 glycosylhydrolase [Flavobacteriales bacterium]